MRFPIFYITPGFKELVRYLYILGAFGVSLLLIGIALALTHLHFTGINVDTIIIYLDFYRNRTVLRNTSDLYQFITIGLALVIINFFIVIELIKKNIYLAHVVAIGTLILSILILITVGGIIRIN